MSYNSKYTGQQVENLLDQVAGGNTGGGSSGSVDLSGYATKEELKEKVDKVEGKQLSTEDFTTFLKNKLEGLSNYDDTTISDAVEKLRADFDTLVSGDTTTAIKTFNEIVAFLDGIEDSQSLDSIIASIEQQIAEKYTKPSTGIPKSDLASDVQTSLGKANTALQEVPNGYAKTSDIPTKVSELENDVNFGTVTSITAGEGLEGGTITDSGTISLPSVVEEGDVSYTAVNNHLFELGNTSSNTSMQLVTINNEVLPHSLSFDKHGRLIGKKTAIKQVQTWKFIEATTSLMGLMSASDKVKLDGVRAMVSHGTSDTTFALTPNVFHKWGTVTSLNLTLAAASDSTLYNEYMFEFVSGTTATTLSLPDTVSWVTEPDIEAGKTYQCSIVNNIGIIVGV